ncbi:MAG TPA: hypothetical protein VLR29_07770, partial [Flavobacterium sp.]|nr:hypothetical protein [Flavobacterium sp.]
MNPFRVSNVINHQKQVSCNAIRQSAGVSLRQARSNRERKANLLEAAGDKIIYQLNTIIKDLQNKKYLSKEEINSKIKTLFHLFGDLI